MTTQRPLDLPGQPLLVRRESDRAELDALISERAKGRIVSVWELAYLADVSESQVEASWRRLGLRKDGLGRWR